MPTHNKNAFSVKAFAVSTANAFFFVSVFILLVTFGFGSKINTFTSLVNTVAIKEAAEHKPIIFDEANKEIKNYPSYGTKYAQIKIPSTGIDLPVYYGDSQEILSYGVGQYAGSYFPGEGGSTILAGHNEPSPGYFGNLLKVKNGDQVILETTYGTFQYTIFDEKVVNQNDLSAFPIEKDKEMLVMYTCYPLGLGAKTERFVAYAVKS